MKKRFTGFTLCFILLISLFPSMVFADEPESELQLAEEILEDSMETDIYAQGEVTLLNNVLYMPDVREEMNSASFWAGKLDNADEVLVDQSMIDAVNQAVLTGSGTGMHDLKNWTEETYDGVQLNESILKSAQSDAEYFYNCGVWYNDEGNRYASKEEAFTNLYEPLIANCVDNNATTEMPVHYAICTKRTCLRAFPTEHPLRDDPKDPDFDYLYLTLIRVNEPLVLKSCSADGKYYLAISSSTSGWIPAEDVAVCQDKVEWLSAWDIAPENTLVIYDDKIYTEDSNYAPQTSGRLLSMGTCLEMADPSVWSGLDINRCAYNNHVVWMPVRNPDGSYKKELALIGENRKVSEGFLPLTSSNLLSVAMNQLGDTYGWGGMLGSEDCSGFTRDVYKCFGIEMARNTTWQGNQPLYKYDLSGMEKEEKADLIRDLPPGSLLIFRGHAMLYLGEDEGKLYVISSVSDIVLDGTRLRVRGGVINTLDVLRGSGKTWLEDLHTAEIPYYTQDVERQFVYRSESGDGQKWTKGSSKAADFSYRRTVNNASAMKHFSGLLIDSETVSDSAYTVSAGGVNISISASFLETLPAGSHTVEALFDDGTADPASIQIMPKQLKGSSVTLSKTLVTYNGKLRTPTAIVKDGAKVLKKGKDFKVQYVNNKDVGTATVSVTGTGDYAGTVKKTFRIKPQSTTVTSVVPAVKGFTVRWKKRPVQTTGYQIQYSSAKKFISHRSLTVSKPQTVLKKIGSLKSKSTYYVKIRTFKNVNGKKYYSSWSAAKKVKTK